MEKSNNIGYTTLTSDGGFGSLSQLYNAPQRKIGYELKVAGLAIMLFVTPISAGAYKSNLGDDHFKKSQMEFFERSHYTFQRITLGQEIVNVKVQPTAAWLQRQETFVSLFKSFSENFGKGQQDIGEFMSMFKTMAGPLSQLTIKDAFVDVSRKKGMIDFNLNLEKGIFLSVAKRTDEMSDDVMFTIARNHETLVIDEMPMSELMPKVSEIMMELKAL
ncbi:MAG: hypothetical protein IJZ11_05475 [Bacteroidaceae bacterium]|nr:hypothetical protein [Bacteroidaceae bacterium]